MTIRGIDSIRWALVALVICAPMPQVAASAAEERVPIRPGATVTISLGEPAVLVDSCGDGGPHSGPTASGFQISPERAASLLTPKPSSQAIRSGTATATIRVSPDLTPGYVFIVSWTAVADGCYSANGGITYVVSLAAPATGAGTSTKRTSGSFAPLMLGAAAFAAVAGASLMAFPAARRSVAAAAVSTAGILRFRRPRREQRGGHKLCVQRWSEASAAATTQLNVTERELSSVRSDLVRGWDDLAGALARSRRSFDALDRRQATAEGQERSARSDDELEVVRRILDAVSRIAAGSTP